MANQACFTKSILKKMWPFQLLVSLLSLSLPALPALVPHVLTSPSEKGLRSQAADSYEIWCLPSSPPCPESATSRRNPPVPVLPVRDRSGEGGEKGSSSPGACSASLPVNMFDLKLTFQILPLSVLEDTEIAGSPKKEKLSLKSRLAEDEHQRGMFGTALVGVTNTKVQNHPFSSDPKWKWRALPAYI